MTDLLAQIQHDFAASTVVFFVAVMLCGNTPSGWIDGLPVTHVIVRSTANITFGRRTTRSPTLHGLRPAICAVAIPGVLDTPPMATDAAIHFVVGSNFSKPAFFRRLT